MSERDLVAAEARSGEGTAGRGSAAALDARALFVALYVLALFVAAVRPTLDPDMWWHLRTGERILQEGVPRQDIFSYTVAGAPWIAHEWLSQAIMWILYEVGGFGALIVGFAAVITATFWLVYVNSAGKPYIAAFLGLLAAFASAPTWGARPQMFNMLFLALFMLLVEAVRRKRRGARAFLWLLLLSVVWANLHSGYLAGVALLVVYVVGDGVQGLWGRYVETGEVVLEGRQVRFLALAAAASLLAAAVNPNGFALWGYPFETLRSPAMQQFIQEWRPPLLREVMFWPFAAMLGLGVLGWTFGRKPSASGLLLFLGTGAAALLSARNIPLFAVVAAPVISRSVAGWLRTGGGEARRTPGRLLQLLNGSILLICLLAGALWTMQVVAGNDAEMRDRFPVAAVDFLEAQGLDEARGFNDYGWGGYLIWRGIPVFVDGRADVYGDEFLFFYQQAALLREGWREPLEQYDVQYALLGRTAVLATMLEEVEGWQEVYADDMARIFVRDE